MTETRGRTEVPEDARDAPLRPTFEAVFQAELPYVWNTLRRLGVRDADAQDQAQEVFVVVHQLLSDYDPARPMRPWLFGIAYRVACRYRALARHRRELGDDAAPEPADPAPGADEAIAAAEARDLVIRALDAIDLGRRAVFVMNVIDERPMPEVAETLGIPLNTAYSRLRLAREEFERAVKRLRPSRGGVP
jgi:RNA polymerase sigma-70 factor (ECF subfamily)